MGTPADAAVDELLRGPQRATSDQAVDELLGFTPLETVPRVALTPKPRGEADLGFVTNAKLGNLEDPVAKAKVAAQAFGIDEADIPNRFAIHADNGRLAVNFPGKGGQRESWRWVEGGGVGSEAGGYAAATLPLVGSLAGLVLFKNAPFLGSVGGASTAAVGKEVAASELGEERPLARSAINVGTEAALTGAGEALGAANVAMRNRAALTDIGEDFGRALGDADKRIEQGRRLGIDIDYAQALGSSRLLNVKRWLTQRGGPQSDYLKAKQEVQNGQVMSAVDRMLNLISRHSDTRAAAGAADDIIAAARKEVLDKSSPKYGKAFADSVRQDTKVDTRETIQYLMSLEPEMKGGNRAVWRGVLGDLQRVGKGSEFAALKQKAVAKLARERGLEPGTQEYKALEGEVAGNLSPFANAAEEAAVRKRFFAENHARGVRVSGKDWMDYRTSLVSEPWDTSLHGLHGAKVALDQRIKDALKAENGPLIHHLEQVRTRLLKAMDEASPTYAEARSLHEAGIKAEVEPIERSLIGVIAKLGKGADMQANLSRAASQMFRNPQLVASTRAMFARQGKDAEWRMFVRAALEQNVQRALDQASKGQAPNLAFNFYAALLGTESQRKALNAAVSADAAALLDDIAGAMGTLRRDPSAVMGSPTAMYQSVERELAAGGRPGPVDDLLAATGVVRDVATGNAERLGQELWLQRNAKAVTSALYDRKKLAALRELRKLPPSAERTMRAAGVVFGQSAHVPELLDTNDEEIAGEAE